MPTPFDSKAIEALVATSLRESPPSISAPTQEPVRKGTSKWALLASILGDAADVGSTVHALKQPGIRELNPILGSNPSNAKVIGFKMAGGALKALIAEAVGKKNPKLGNIIGFGNGVISGGIAASNMSKVK